MRITRLSAARLRNLQPFDLRPGAGLNLVLGGNGAGKTSLLETVHLLAYGRSFRGRVRDGLVRTGAPDLEVFVEWEEPGRPARRAGLRHAGHEWQGRLDGADTAQLNQLCSALAVLTFEPGSHALVSGGGDARRRFLDWGLFHVEPDFLPVWRRYARALKQRNALLKQRASGTELDVWDAELAAAAAPLDVGRETYLDRLQQRFQNLSATLLPNLGEGRLRYQPGWKRGDLTLADALLLARGRDQASGFTSLGPHRADWRIEHAGRPGDETLSRGQAKLTALACLMAQGEDFDQRRGHWPVVLLDDLAAELDSSHQGRLLDYLGGTGAQVFVTGTHAPKGQGGGTATTFHVEHGEVLMARVASS